MAPDPRSRVWRAVWAWTSVRTQRSSTGPHGPMDRGRFVRRPITRATGPGGPSGGPGTAGVREPRRPCPPGFPSMQAALDPPMR